MSSDIIVKTTDQPSACQDVLGYGSCSTCTPYHPSVAVSTMDAGRIESFEGGEKVGLKKGLKEGHKNAQLTIARNLLKMGITPEKVAEATGLTLEEIKE